MARKGGGRSASARTGQKSRIAGKTEVIKSPGKKPVSFKRGGLHESVGVPQSQKIPAAKMAAAKAGKYGSLARKQADFAAGFLSKGRRTAANNRRTST